MVVKAFCDKLFENEHEWNQFKEVYNLINEKYANIEEPIYILSNVFLSNAQIDVLILARKGIAILELKSYEGKIYGSENGEWVVITANGKEVSLSENLFQQLNQQKFAIVDKLKFIRKGNFERIEEEKLYRIQCWGYFIKGSTYDIYQVDKKAHIWFDVITANDLIEKMSFFKAGYLLGYKDMDAIVKGLNLKPYSFEKPLIQEDSTFESNWNKELSVFIEPQNWNKIFGKIKDSNIITVVGDRNVGKTTTIINLANELKKSGYRIHEDKESLINSRGEKDRKEYYHLIHNKNVFVLDDLFGKTEYEPSLGNKWVYLLIDILDSTVNQSKIIIGSRRDVIDNFIFNNNELSRWNLLNEFKNSIVELKFSDYDEKNRKGIFDNNLNYIQLNEKNKEIILNRNIEKITKELLLPGDISYFIQKAKEKVDFQESELEIYIDKAKQQINSIATDIKKLKDYEKIFLYSLYINQDFSITDLKAIYQRCLLSGLDDRSYFDDCINSLEGIIKIKIESQWFNKIKKIDFVHPIYKDAIENLINETKEECNRLEYIISKLFNSLQERSISDWKSNSTKYDTLRFHIFQIVSMHYIDFSYHTRDFVIEILNSLSYKARAIVDDPELSIWGDVIEILNENVKSYPTSRYIEKLFYYYDKFDDELKNKFNSLFKNIDCMGDLAYCFAYYLDPQTVIKFQDKLKELSRGNDEAKSSVAKCIIKNYEIINEDNKKLIISIGIKSTIMQYLIHNYSILSRDLKDILEKQIVSSDKTLLIETCKTFLLNYSFLPNEIRRHYDFVFCLKDELVIKEVGKAFEEWFRLAFIEHDSKREKLQEKVLDLYCNWLKNDKIILTNYHEIIELYGEGGVWGLLGWLPDSIYPDSPDDFLINPKWNNPYLSKLKEAFETNMMMLLNLLNSYTDRAIIYRTAFDCYTWSGNMELFNQISNVLNESADVKFAFLEGCFHLHLENNKEKVSKYPLKITVSQTDLIKKLSEVPNSLHVRTKAKEVLHYIKASIDNHSMEIVSNDFS